MRTFLREHALLVPKLKSQNNKEHRRRRRRRRRHE